MKLLLGLLLVLPSFLLAQKKCSVTISFASDIDKNGVSIMFYNGKNRFKVPFNPDSNSIVIRDTVYSIYGIVEVGFPQIVGTKICDDFAMFYITSEKSTIRFLKNDSSEKKLGNSTVINAIKANDLGRNQMYDFVRKEHDDLLQTFIDIQTGKIGYSDSTSKLLAAKDNRELAKRLGFIKSNGNLYCSFNFFCNSFLNSGLLSVDSLLAFYSSTFPDKFKNSYEGREALKVLQNRKAREVPGLAPDFVTRDFAGKQVRLSDFKNKYVIINFWASYCAPCVQEFPALTKMIKSLPQDQVVVIYVNRDKTYEAFAKMKEKYKLVGIHVTSNDNLIDNYKAASIPQLYLIDKNRKILYDRDILNDYDLSKLQRILCETFNLSSQSVN